MRATLQQLLELTRQVFGGAINRTALSRRSTREQAFVAAAIMLVARQDFLDNNNMVRGDYTRILEALLSAGTVNRLAGEKGFKSGEALVQAARSAELYDPTPGRGGVKPIILNPPPELVALVRELDYTSAIAVFLRDSAAGVEQEKRWRKEYERTTADAAARRRYQYHMDQVLQEIEEQFGLEGLRDLRSRIEKRLRS